MKNSARATIIAALSAVALGVIKFKSSIFAVLKGGWLLQATWTLLFSFWSYGVFYGWKFGALLISMFFFHEGGHWLAMKMAGLNPKAPVYIPFIGAYVAMTKLPKDEFTSGWVAYAGPFVGGLSSFVVYAIGLGCNSTALMAGGVFGAVLNLFQLIPCWPLDGHFIANSISKWLMIPGTILLGVLAVKSESLLLAVLTIMAAILLFGKLMRGRSDSESIAAGLAKTVGELELAITTERLKSDSLGNGQRPLLWQKSLITVAYVGLSAALGFGSAFAMSQVSERLNAEGKPLPKVLNPLNRFRK